MKKYLILIAAIIVALTAFLIIKLPKKDNAEVISAYDEIFKLQAEVDKELLAYQDDSSYTFDNPKIVVNPYKIAPLTAIIIFQTDEEVSVEVTINDKKITTIDKSIKHSIPIYGMFANYENKIKLKLSNGKEKEYTIKTDEYKGDKVTLVKTSTKVKNSLYFLSPNFVDNCIIDENGEVVWYIDGGYAGDIEFLDNGHFYISNPRQGENGVKINYSSFVEMDYLGKIYKEWITDYGLHHELIPLKDNKMLVLGGKDNSPFVDSVIYIMDLKTGNTLQELDLYEFLHDIDPELIENLGAPFDLVNNSAEYDEETHDMMISLRGMNSLMKFNLDTKEIKWIFGDPDIWGDKFSKYILKVTDNTRYLGGQHSAFYTKEGYISVHNNDIDQFDLSESNLSHYINRHSTNVILKVDEKNMTIKTVWSYDANPKLFSNVAGHMQILDNNHKVLTYGWAMKQDAYKKANEILYTDPVYKNGVVMEIDENDNVLFEATIPGLIYRTFKIDSLYTTTSNYEIKSYERIIGYKNNGEEIEVKEAKKLVKNAKKYEGEFKASNNRISISDELNKDDEVKVLFIGDKAYNYIYKNKTDIVPKAFNSGIVTRQMNVPTGKYHVYININGTYYDTEKVVEF